jgi:hypothetical protein
MRGPSVQEVYEGKWGAVMRKSEMPRASCEVDGVFQGALQSVRNQYVL